MDLCARGPHGQFVSDFNEEMNIAGTDSGSSGGAEMIEDSDIMFLGEYEVDPTGDALEILQYLAEENNAQVNMEVTEHDSGHLSQPTTFCCKLEAGSYNKDSCFLELSPTDSDSSYNNNNNNAGSGGGNNGQVDDEFGFDFSGDHSMFLDSDYQCIKFQPFQENNYCFKCNVAIL